jgi:hypothetical protein
MSAEGQSYRSKVAQICPYLGQSLYAQPDDMTRIAVAIPASEMKLVVPALLQHARDKVHDGQQARAHA